MSRYGWDRGRLWDSPTASVRDFGGPTRTVNGDEDQAFERRPVGFCPPGQPAPVKSKATLLRELFQRVSR